MHRVPIRALDPKPDFVLTGGDLAFDGNYTEKAEFVEQIRLYKEITGSLGIPYYNCMGNHDVLGWSARRKVTLDDPGLGKKQIMDALGWEKSFYSFDHGGWHFGRAGQHLSHSGKGRTCLRAAHRPGAVGVAGPRSGQGRGTADRGGDPHRGVLQRGADHGQARRQGHGRQHGHLGHEGPPHRPGASQGQGPCSRGTVTGPRNTGSTTCGTSPARRPAVPGGREAGPAPSRGTRFCGAMATGSPGNTSRSSGSPGWIRTTIRSGKGSRSRRRPPTSRPGCSGWNGGSDPRGGSPWSIRGGATLRLMSSAHSLVRPPPVAVYALTALTFSQVFDRPNRKTQ